MNTDLFRPWNLLVISVVSVGAYWAVMRFAPGLVNGDR